MELNNHDASHLPDSPDSQRIHFCCRASERRLFIVADDLGWSDTTLYGTKTLYQTPNIDASQRREPANPRIGLINLSMDAKDCDLAKRSDIDRVLILTEHTRILPGMAFRIRRQSRHIQSFEKMKLFARNCRVPASAR